ncbi:SURF1 family cytochrome oxidase biogenesis protein [Inmirania thermothiophila]|uniref:SURF1-like protein n=1 Tax=Inmirania thermothiophila TaxID=1750597 RepID=A0A3N1Y1S5_9GAMM|nr:SURF1 family cytochrome oxidase biogenesis protein [Inmirania thermothiophila]ROR32783.1 SURF1 family protein [Inmirania thermothiophila]
MGPAPPPRYSSAAARRRGAAPLLLLAAALFTGLGLWQLRRAGEKQALLAEAAARWAAAPAPLAALPGPDARFRAVRLRGRYEAQAQVLVGPQGRDGRLGYLVYTPLRTAGNEAVVVARGWQARPTPPAPPSPTASGSRG